MYMKNGKLIKFSDYMFLPKILQEQVSILSHVGVKQQLNNDFWVLTLFTTKPITYLYDNVIMHNILLQNNIHKYINPSIILLNSILSEYVSISDNIAHFPKYKELKNLSINSQIELIMKDSIDAFKLSMLSSNFNDPFIISEIIAENQSKNLFKKSSIIHRNQLEWFTGNVAKYHKNSNYLRFKFLNNENIIHFTNNFEDSLNIKNESYYKNNLYFK